MSYYSYTVVHHWFSCDHDLCVAQKGVTADSFCDARDEAADEGWTFYDDYEGCPRHNAADLAREKDTHERARVREIAERVASDKRRVLDRLADR